MSPEALISALGGWQSADGGWGYGRKSASWTEPTALALLALQGCPIAAESIARGSEWLLRTQRSDGGWAPRPNIDRGTWVTSLAVLSLASAPEAHAAHRGAQWLLTQPGEQPSRLDRFRGWLLGQPVDNSPPGFSWYPGTASWVIPTATGILALERTADRLRPHRVHRRVAEARRFLMARQCAGGAWNHGGIPIRSDAAGPYPETTGIALLAMNPDARSLKLSLDRAESLLRHPASQEGENWLRLGMAAHGRTTNASVFPLRAPRTSIGLALQLMVARNHNPFLPRARS